MGRGVITYSISYISGIYICYISGVQISNNLFIFILISAILILTLLNKLKKRSSLFLFFAQCIFFSLGINAYYLSGKEDSHSGTENTRWEITNLAAEELKKFTPEQQEHSILCALSLGIKEYIPKDIKNSYSNAGVMHILALSGMHIGIVYLIINSLLFPLNLNYKLRRIKYAISIAFICIYALATGASPSITRATIMIVIYSISHFFSRKSDKWNNLALCALIMGIINPDDVTQIGFQLSFAAIIGIIGIYPTIEKSITIIYNNLEWNRTIKFITKKILEIIGISISCQITTLPFTIYYFGTNAQYFLISNLIAIPLTTIILYLLVLAIATFWCEPLNQCICKALIISIKSMNLLIDFISN